MAFFGITVETIAEVWPHSNADRLELGKVTGLGFQFVIGKGNYQVGDKVLYFPIDSLLPAEVAARIGLAGLDANQEKHRLRTLRLRGEVSQGYVCPLSLLPAELHDAGSEAITRFFEVEKYEPPV